MSKGKLILIALVVVLLAIGGVVVYTLTNLDSIVAAAIEKYGSQVTQTQVGVDNVHIGLTDGSGSLAGLTVANPSGFSRADIFSLGKIAVRIDTASVTTDTIVIPEILIAAPKVLYEVDAKGRSNLDVLKSNLPKSSGGSSASKDDGGGKKLVIKRLVIENGEANIDLTALLDKQMNAKLPRIELRNIGEKQGGATPTEVGKKVMDALAANLENVVSGLGVDQLIERELRGKLDEAAGAAQKKVTEEMEKMTGSGDAGKEVTDTLKGLLDSK